MGFRQEFDGLSYKKCKKVQIDKRIWGKKTRWGWVVLGNWNPYACWGPNKTTVMLAKMRQHNGCQMILWCEQKAAGSVFPKRVSV